MTTNTNEYCSRKPFARGKVLPSIEKVELEPHPSPPTEPEWCQMKDYPNPDNNDAERWWLLSKPPSYPQRQEEEPLLHPASLQGSAGQVWRGGVMNRQSLSLSLPFPNSGLLEQLPEDLLFQITSFLDASSLVQMRATNRKYRQMCSRNEAGWHLLCLQLRNTKVHVCPEVCRLLSTSSPSLRNLSTTNIMNNDTHYHTCIDGKVDSQKNRDTVMMKAYRHSIQDAQERQCITLSELCFDPVTQQGTIWSFRFKESAGRDWTLADPWYHDEPCRQMIFLRNGTVVLLGRGGHGAGTTTAASRLGVHSSSLHGNPHDNNDDNDHNRQEAFDPMAERNQDANADPVANLPRWVDPATPQQWTTTTMTWRFITRPMDLPTRPLGSYIRLSVGGRDVPTYSVRRSPTGNWGFVMESCWGLFASFDLPARSRPPQAVVTQPPLQPKLLRNKKRKRTTTTQAVATRTTADTEDNEEEEEVDQEEERMDHRDRNDDDDEFTHAQRRRRTVPRGNDFGASLAISSSFSSSASLASLSSSSSSSSSSLHEAMDIVDPELPLRDDSHLLITNEIQWREAFLYNVGARILPDGEEATETFDRAWGGGGGGESW